jgi:hypothetical protein
MATVDVLLSGKPLGEPPSIGAFDFVVSFSPSILLPINVVFGPFLGDPASMEALTEFSCPSTWYLARFWVILLQWKH